MDNDILIDQARQLYTKLLVMQLTQPIFEPLIARAYRRYQRRLNRCVLCYQHRNYECIREPRKKRILCQHPKLSK